jgi:hypothetical protein
VPIARVANFLPSTGGLHFANAFPHQRTVRLGVGPVAVRVGDAANGLCGGMAFTARDLFEAGDPPPPDRECPAGGTARFQYLVDRQVDSFDLGRVPLRFYDLMAFRGPSPGPLARLLGRKSHAAVMVRDEWPRIRADIDAGRLSMVGLVRIASRDPRRLGENHQVACYGYSFDPGHLVLAVYDPNHPDDDSVEIRLIVDDSRSTAGVEYSAGEALVCFFRAPYSPKDPAAFRFRATI